MLSFLIVSFQFEYCVSGSSITFLQAAVHSLFITESGVHSTDALVSDPQLVSVRLLPRFGL